VAERERLTKKERRERSREERKRKEAEAAKKRQRDRLRNGVITVAIVGVIAAVMLQAFLGGTATIDETILISSDEAEAARQAAGCEVLVERQPLPERYHFEANQTPPLATIYPDIRPTHSGPHTVQTHPIISDGASRQIDEASTTHNLEHGSIIAWYDPEQVDRATANEMGEWSATLNASGFRVDRGGVAIFVSPYEDPGISSGKTIALRAWGTAMDCDEWDETVANAFVIEHYGMHGIAPERMLAPYPTDVLAFEDREVGDSDAPIDGTPIEEMPEGEVPDDLDDDPDADDEG
jgi:hypothetical protein